MTTQELHLEQLLDKTVLDVRGDRVGRIEEVRAEQQGDEWVVVEYQVGFAALIGRLSAWTLATGFLRLLGARKLYTGYRVPWDKLDLSDWEHPRLTCTLAELKQLNQQLT